MAKLTRVFAVAAFVLGLGLAAAQSTSAAHEDGEDPADTTTVLANLVAQANQATVDQDNDNEQNAANVIAVGQEASCTVGDNSNYNTCINIQTSVVVADQVNVQDQDVDQANAADVDQANFAAFVDQAIDDDDDAAAE